MKNSQIVEIDVSSDESFVPEIKQFLSEMFLAVGVNRESVEGIENEIGELFDLVFENSPSGDLHLEYGIAGSELSFSLSDQKGASYGMRKSFNEE